MRLKTLVALCLAVMSLSLLSSCDAFFNTNMFKAAGLGQVSASSLAAKDSSELYDSAYTSDGKLEVSFADALAGDAGAKATVLAKLEADFTSPDAGTRQRSAALCADIELQTSGASAVVNNVLDFLASGKPLPSSGDTSGVTDLVKSLLPSALLSDKAAFTAAIEGFVAADAAYQVMGASVGSSGAQSGLAAGAIGTAAQSALVAAVVAGVVPSSGTVADALWLAVQGDSSNISGFTEPSTSSGYLGSLLSAAGISL
jgi:hypothetical protein